MHSKNDPNSVRGNDTRKGVWSIKTGSADKVKYLWEFERSQCFATIVGARKPIEKTHSQNQYIQLSPWSQQERCSTGLEVGLHVVLSSKT
jgi:hypothetical protein